MHTFESVFILMLDIYLKTKIPHVSALTFILTILCRTPIRTRHQKSPVDWRLVSVMICFVALKTCEVGEDRSEGVRARGGGGGCRKASDKVKGE